MKPVLTAFRYLLITLVVAAFFLWGWLDHFSVQLPIDWTNPQLIIDYARNSGFIGPLVIIGSMAVAIVFSPLPSAPIALAAGAVYGHYEGTVYVFAGSLLGASIAFSIARILGFKAAYLWLEQQLPGWKLQDPKRLMWLILASRLMPFVSFDLISYAAGITTLSYRRFFIATAIGILPASFLMAHFGDTAKDQSLVINVGLVIVLVIAAGVWRFTSTKKNTRKTDL
ncbi:TVP38/TMEM64 family protein [Neptunomonas qingdaonensis]|uniref:TVP38/TMEM64 family membrane protein n=1 Tax=Neptunomonas qingdaonensis TaxID=1045558 RepID=A0A1I2SMM1_9GAMM|nr:VTT domain-containing protein [Neptunomonas qingdaonensis]SFG52979.1 Uncharacterized membrane protein YdjX, TVP38/TMEM64 family, SNARE-associated domain [Neptunomonas qingdaonensis]